MLLDNFEHLNQTEYSSTGEGRISACCVQKAKNSLEGKPLGHVHILC